MVLKYGTACDSRMTEVLSTQPESLPDVETIHNRLPSMRATGLTMLTSTDGRSRLNSKRLSRQTGGSSRTVTNLSVDADAQHRCVACTQQSRSPPSHLRACTTCILTRPLQVHALPSTASPGARPSNQ